MLSTAGDADPLAPPLSMRPRTALFRRLEAFVAALGASRARRWTVFAATLLAAPSVGAHRCLDDFVLALIAQGRGASVGLTYGKFDLFTFTTGVPENDHRLMDVGLMLPWWSDERLRIAFFRPLSSFTHWLDERLWPACVPLMHFHSLAWFAILLASASWVFRCIEESPVLAGFGFFLYAIDDAHGPAVAWLANRNALIATAFGAAALSAHVISRKRANPVAAALATAAFGVGLLAGESAIGVLAYLVAYAIFLDEKSTMARVASLAPYVAVTVVWRLLWAHAGYGARGSGAYIDPLTSPAEFLAVFPAKLAMLVHGQFSAPPSDLAFLAPPTHQPFLLALATTTVVVVSILLWPIVRRDRIARFWALGMVLSLLPLVATFPSDRLLLFSGLGAMGLLARLFRDFIEAGAKGALAFSAKPVVIGCFAVLHLVAAPLVLPFRSWQMELFALSHDRAEAAIPSDPGIEAASVVIVGAPTLLFANYIQAERQLTGVRRPAHLYLLATQGSALDVERAGPASLLIHPEGGFLYTPLERHYRGDLRAMPTGHRVALSTMTAEVVASLDDGRPSSVRFDFDAPRSTYRFVTWRGDRFEPFVWPEPGRRVTLPREDFGQILGQTAKSLF